MTSSSSCWSWFRLSLRFFDLARACCDAGVARSSRSSLAWTRQERDPWTHVQDGHGWRWQRRGRAMSRGTWGWRRCDNATIDDVGWMFRTTPGPNRNMPSFPSLSFFLSISFFLSFFLSCCWLLGWRWMERIPSKERKKESKKGGWMGAHRKMGGTDPSPRTARRNPSTVDGGIHDGPGWIQTKTTDTALDRKRKERHRHSAFSHPRWGRGGGSPSHPVQIHALDTRESNHRQVETSGDSRSNRNHAYPNTIHRPGRHRTKKKTTRWGRQHNAN